MVISIGLWNADDDILNKTNFGAFYLFLSFKIDYGFKDILIAISKILKPLISNT